MKIKGFAYPIEQAHCEHGACTDLGWIFYSEDYRDAWPLTENSLKPPAGAFVEIRADVRGAKLHITDWTHVFLAGPPGPEDLRIGVFVRVDPSASDDFFESQQRVAESRAMMIEAFFRQAYPPSCQIEARGVAVRSDEPTQPHRFMRFTIIRLRDEGLWPDWDVNRFITFGGPRYQGAGGHNAGPFSVVYSGGSLLLAYHEKGHSVGMRHNMEIDRDGEVEVYGRGRGCDVMGIREAGFNVLARRSANLLYANRVLETDGSVDAILCPVGSDPEAIPDGAYQAVILPDTTVLSQHSPLGLWVNGPTDAVHVHRWDWPEHRRYGNFTIGQARIGRDPLEHDGWTISCEEMAGGMMRVRAVRDGENPPAAQFPEFLQVEPGSIEAHHAGLWVDERHPEQGLCLLYKDNHVHGCWFTATQDTDSRGRPIFYTLQGRIEGGVAELAIRTVRDGDLVEVGRGVLTFDAAYTGELQFIIDDARGRLALSKVMNAINGSGWWFNPDVPHEGVIRLVDEHITQAWLFRPVQWRYFDISPNGEGTSYAVDRSSFLSTQRGRLENAVSVSVEDAPQGIVVEHDGNHWEYPSRLV